MSRKKICSSVGISIFILFISFCLAVSVSAEPNPKNVYTGNIGKRPLEYVPGQVVVKFAESVGDDEVEQIVRGVGAKTKRRAYKNAFRVLTAPRGQEMKMVAVLTKNSRVLYAELDYLAHADFVPFVPNDRYYYPYQWNLDNDGPGGIQMEEAWGITGRLDPSMRGGDPNVVVAVLDTGIAYEDYNGYCQAPDLAETHFVSGYDFVHGDSHANDDNGHGTHVAGTIAQSTDNDRPDNDLLGVAGVAFNVSLMPVKVLNADGQGKYSQIAEGIRWAADNGAHVINMSLSGRWPNNTLLNAVRYAYDKGLVIVASSGNESRNTPGYPARYDQVIAVGATTYDNKLAYYSNKGNELCAPGGVDNQDLNGDGRPDRILQQTFNLDTKDVCDFWYWFTQGTSMAAPHVSGLAALILSVDPSLTNGEIRGVLRDNADDIGDDGACEFGLINAYRALDAVADVDNPPSVTITNPSDGETVFGPVTITAYATDVGGGVTKVEFFIDDDDEPVFVDTNGSDGWSYNWNTEDESDGTHTISATAWDTVNQKATNTISVTVDNPEPSYIHLGDLDGSSFNFFWVFWGTTIKVTVHDSNEEPVPNAVVSGMFNDGSTVWKCTTKEDGVCEMEPGYQVTQCLQFSVTGVQHPQYEYMASFNHDPDGDSDGTTITTCRP